MHLPTGCGAVAFDTKGAAGKWLMCHMSALILFSPNAPEVWTRPVIGAAIDRWAAQPAARPVAARATVAALSRDTAPGNISGLFRLLRKCVQVRNRL
jgi:hypothetical protein